MPAGETIETSLSGGVLEIALNRPDRLNAINTAMRAELAAAFTMAAEDEAVRCILLSARGRGFCAGQDLGERPPPPPGERHDLGKALGEEYNPLFRQIAALPKPVVSAVNGVAAGAGLSLAIAADVTFAASDARFILSFANIGLGPDCGTSWHLPRLIGSQRAKALAMSGEAFSGEDAARWGMVWKAVPPAELQSAAAGFAARLAAQPPLALATVKRAMDASWHASLSDQLEAERIMQRELGHTDDYVEGVAAFREKRKAVFTGR